MKKTISVLTFVVVLIIFFSTIVLAEKKYQQDFLGVTKIDQLLWSDSAILSHSFPKYYLTQENNTPESIPKLYPFIEQVFLQLNNNENYTKLSAAPVNRNYSLKRQIQPYTHLQIVYNKENQELLFSTKADKLNIDNQDFRARTHILYSAKPINSKAIVKIGGHLLDLNDYDDSKSISIYDLLSTPIGVYVTDETNLLETHNPSFEDGLWSEKAWNCVAGGSLDDVDIELSDDASEGDRSLLLSSLSGSACTSKIFRPSFSTDQLYKISVDAKNISGDVIQYYYKLETDEVGGGAPRTERVVAGDGWSTYSEIIKPNTAADGLNVHLYAPSSNNQKNVSLYDNLRLEAWLPRDISSYYLYSAENFINTPRPRSIEWKPVNRWKSNVNVNGVSGSFLLVYPEEYNEKLKVYIQKEYQQNRSEIYLSTKSSLSEQATLSEIRDFVNQGLISWTGSKFISKKIDGTIRNDNLPSGMFWNTLGDPYISEDLHYQINGYSNAWLIDFEKICKSDLLCQQNTDGTYNISFVVEHPFSKYVHLVILLSSIVLLGSLGYLLFYLNRRKFLN